MPRPLTPEQQAAFGVFEMNLSSSNKLMRENEQRIEDICITGTAFFTKYLLDSSTLPRETNWLWNKSKPTQTYELRDGSSVSFYKLNSRRKKGEKMCPEFKVWIFNVTLPDQSRLSYFYCERGIDITPVTLGDLSFLSPYTTVDLAKSFGWI